MPILNEMITKKLPIFISALICLAMFSCASDDNYVPTPEHEQVSPVVFDIDEVPYQTLSEYNFFDGDMKNLNPVYGVLPYNLNSTLFSDYAKKKRFLWMPDDVKANYVSDSDIIDFPVGTILIKNFYYNNVLPDNKTRIIETRLMILKDEGWVFANYVWDDEQSEASFDLDGSVTAVEWLEEGVNRSANYRIPAGPECHTCHKTGDTSIPIGPKPRNLNAVFDYGDESKNQLQKWAEFGYLDENYPSTIETLPRWDDTSIDLNTRVRAYLEINCAHCHSEQSHCAYRPIRFNFNASSDPVNIGVCVEPDTDIAGAGLSHIVVPETTARSVLHYRISATEESVRMPLLGRTLVHEEGKQLIEDWINSLQTSCN